MLNNNTDVNGNKDAVKFLENCLQTCKDQGMGYAICIMARDPGQYLAGYTGTVELEEKALEGLKELEAKIQGNLDNRTPPKNDKGLDASHVCYNVTKSPLSFDFLTWLVDAEMTRVRKSAPGPLKVGFWFGRDGKSGLTGSDGRSKMLDKVVRPSMDLIGAVEDPMASYGEFKEFFSFRDIVKGSKAGEPVPKYKTDKVLDDVETGNYITITLREAEYWPHRNSRLSEWLRFARYLRSKGETVIFVRDTSKADEPIEDFRIYPEASRDLITRMALYQQAKCNMFVSNGPVTLAYFSDVPWLKFLELDDQGAYNAGKTGYWKEMVGLNPEEQFPWSTDKQRIIWKPDFYTNLVLAWNELGL